MLEPAITNENNQSTVAVRDADVLGFFAARRHVGRAVYHLAADCERFAELIDPETAGTWREGAGQLLLAGRQLLSVYRASDGDAGGSLASLQARLEPAVQRVLRALERMLTAIPITREEELLGHEARAIKSIVPRLYDVGAAAEPAGEARDVPPPETPADAARTTHALVVDDDPALRAALARFVKQFGLVVTTAKNGKEALRVARELLPDLVLTDLNMPEMDGMALLRALKKDDRTREIPVVVISAQDDLESVVTCLEEGADDHITKPFNPTLLKARVGPLLERKRARDVERRHLRRVSMITSAAEAVERDAYSPGLLDALRPDDDAIGRLARVFDRMVMGLRFREERLQRRLRQLRTEVTSASNGTGLSAGDGAGAIASGDLLAGRYEIRGQLGRGGMGTVYQAHDRELREDVAIKVVRPDLVAAHPTLVERLKSEIKLTRKISHKNVVRAYDLGDWNGTYFISMELVTGITLADLIDRRGRLSIDATLAIGEQLADALATAHDLQIVHRDIKPANLLIDETGTLKVMDFGLARSVEQEANVTQAGFIVGTPQYMAPEQLLGGAVDARSDLFSAGVVLFECLSGRPPFVDDSPAPIAAAFLDGRVPRLQHIAPDIPAGLASLVHRLLEVRPAQRVASARELAEQLRQLDHVS
jgi:CheY-like chemotaxis protein